MAHTAMTRAKNQVLLVTDGVAATEAVERTPYLKLVDIALDQILAEEIAAA